MAKESMKAREVKRSKTVAKYAEKRKALKEAGAHVKGMLAIFTYGFDTATKNFKKADCKFISLCNYSTLLQEAVKQEYINKTDLETLEKWRENPSKWGK